MIIHWPISEPDTSVHVTESEVDDHHEELKSKKTPV
jgi:hypothetical protein